MEPASFAILLAALVLDWRYGEPEVLWSRLPHPIALFGKAIGWFDCKFNLDHYDDQLRYRYGSMAISILVVGAVLLGTFLGELFNEAGSIGLVFECLIVCVLLAQRSLYDHVFAVVDGFRIKGLEGARAAVGMIVGRDPAKLNRQGVSRASIETLAENFSDGVVAPAFWYLIFGLPGIIAYKIINTADSMIGYRNDKYRHFGRTAALVDDLANWLPARVSAVLLWLSAWGLYGWQALRRSMVVTLRDGRLHRSPNAGWPESAMAGALDIALGGPRDYGDQFVAQSYLNASGKRNLSFNDIMDALHVFKVACILLWVCLVVFPVVSVILD